MIKNYRNFLIFYYRILIPKRWQRFLPDLRKAGNLNDRLNIIDNDYAETGAHSNTKELEIKFVVNLFFSFLNKTKAG